MKQHRLRRYTDCPGFLLCAHILCPVSQFGAFTNSADPDRFMASDFSVHYLYTGSYIKNMHLLYTGSYIKNKIK